MLEVYGLEDPQWDKTVKSFKEHDVYYLSDYVRAFAANGDGMPQLIYLTSRTARAVNVVMKRDLAQDPLLGKGIAQGCFYDFASPYGYGGFLVEGQDFEPLSEEYAAYCMQNHIICEFVRFHPLLGNWRQVCKLYDVTCLSDTVCMDTSDKDTIWKNLTSKNRNVIRKAAKSGVRIFWQRSPQMIEPFMRLYDETMKRNHAQPYYFFNRSFYQSILENLKYHAMWFYAQKDGDIAAMAIMMFCNGKMHYHLSASDPAYQSLAPVNLLLYEAAVWAALNGYKQLHLGGGVGGGHDSLYKFKKAFYRGEDMHFYIGKKIFDPKSYEKFVQIRKDADKRFDGAGLYFPLYRS